MFERMFGCATTKSWVAIAVVGALYSGMCNAQVADANADWAARSSAPGVFYKNNFDFADTQALISSSYGGFNYPERAQLETSNKLSGRGAFKANIPSSSGEGTVSYRHSFDMPAGSQTKNLRKKAFYYQFQVYLPKYILDHRFATVGGTSGTSHKYAIIMEPDQSFAAGEVVIINPRFRGFVGAYRMTSSGSADQFQKAWSGGPCNGSPEYGYQAAIDAGPQSSGGQTDATSCALFKRRYGPMHYSFSGTNNYGAGTLTAQGNPDPDAAVNGAVWQADAWNVVEVFVDENADTVQLWHSKRGDAPKLVINEVGSARLGKRENNFTGVQLLPRLEELAADSSRQDTYAIYGEIIASDQFIPFPGHTNSNSVRPNPPANVTVLP